MLTCLWKLVCPENPLMPKEGMLFLFLQQTHARAHLHSLRGLGSHQPCCLGPSGPPLLLLSPIQCGLGIPWSWAHGIREQAQPLASSVSLGKCTHFLLLL